MAKFCGNCGAKMNDSAKVCGQCGTPVDPDFKKNNTSREKKKFPKWVKWVVLVLVLVVGGAIAFKVFSGNGYDHIVKEVVEVYETGDVDALMNDSSMLYMEDGGDEPEEYLVKTIDNQMDKMEEELGRNYVLTYEVEEEYTLPQRQVRKLQDMFEAGDVDYDVDNLEDIKVIDLVITGDSGDDTYDIEQSIIVIKENGKWKFLLLGDF
ncbi:zinc ribbon domain-containing protein [uncultured Dubosiella sp.]|uniref:zinc ribbon domain-containing protein n=1 Tax=uncultured Dubosiella sp. TaxID=1937011 RepID=UPI0025B027AE|nr:zinc ribbon domain-containing protein [uncultured Dubosiella sp.]